MSDTQTDDSINFNQALERLPKPSYSIGADGLNLCFYYLHKQDASEIADSLAKNQPVVEVSGSNIVRVSGQSGVVFGDHLIKDTFFSNHGFPNFLRGLDWYAAEEPEVNWEPPANPSIAVWRCRGHSHQESENAECPEIVLKHVGKKTRGGGDDA